MKTLAMWGCGIVASITVDAQYLAGYKKISETYSHSNSAKSIKVSEKDKKEQLELDSAAEKMHSEMMNDEDFNFKEITDAITAGDMLPIFSVLDQGNWKDEVKKVRGRTTNVEKAVSRLGFRGSARESRVFNIVYLRTSSGTLDREYETLDGGVQVPMSQLVACMSHAREKHISITHIIHDKRKSRYLRTKLHDGHSKMLALVRSGRVGAVIASDAIRISGDSTISAMSRESCRAMGTDLLLACRIGVDPADHHSRVHH